MNYLMQTIYNLIGINDRTIFDKLAAHQVKPSGLMELFY